jgi:hypothetical protein
MVVKEYWWVGKENEAVKSVRWAKPTLGQRDDIMSWFRAEQAKLEQRLVVITKTNTSSGNNEDGIKTLNRGTDD